MKKLGFIFLLSVVASSSFAGNVYVSKINSGNIKVYVTKFRSSADLVVYKTSVESQAEGHDEIWYLSDFQSNSTPIRYVDNAINADIKVFFTDFVSEAGWEKKFHPLIGKFH